MHQILNLPRKGVRILRMYLRVLWVRVAVLGLLAVIAVMSSSLISGLIPESWQGIVKGSSADRLLDLIATAMLTVTTFSLTVMVTVHRASSSQFTPRIHQLIRQDAVTQNTLATFIGVFVYALVGIVLREIGFYGDEEGLALFLMTLVVLGFTVWSLVRWTLHLQTLGSLLESTRQVETITEEQFTERLENPCLGATPLTDGVPDDGMTVVTKDAGYIQHIHPEPIQEAAEEHDVEIYLLRNVGDFVFLREPLVRITGLADDADDDTREALKECIHDNIVMGDERTYDQDPRFGLQTMSEIGSKALSPGINDPGTALDVLNRCGRILSSYRDETQDEADPLHPRLHVAPLDAGELIADAFSGVSRDGASLIEVQHRLQKVLAGLMRHPDDGLSKAAREFAEDALGRALDNLDFEPDRDTLRAAAKEGLEPN